MKPVKVIKTLFLVFTLLVLPSVDVMAKSYIYGQSNEAVESPDTYTVSKEVNLIADGVAAVSPQDVFYSASDKVYVVDTDNNRILIYDNKYEFRGVLSQFMQIQGDITTLNKPEGIYVDKDETIYIADTGNHRIIKCDAQGNMILQIEKPDNLIGVADDSVFNPTKIAVDKSGRIYVVARNYNMGLLQLDENGRFIGYIGAPKVQYSLAQMLWRRISTQEQLSKMEQYVPTEYNNITVDEEGFIYGTIGTLDADALEKAIQTRDLSGTVTPVKRLNTSGKDVLKRNGFSAPLGDLEYEEVYSKIVDVSYTSGGMYALLDVTHGHIFVYESKGNLLCAFGNDKFTQCSSFTYAGDKLLVLDARLAKLFVYEATTYGEMVFKAVKVQYNGDFDEAYALWSDVAAYNYNFEYAFTGLGQSYLYSEQYEQAMECFQRIGDKENYSKAKELLRKEKMKTAFPVIFISIIGVVGVAIVYRVTKKIYLYMKDVEES